MSREIQRNFAEATLADAREMVRVGFELETQTVNGQDWSELEGGGEHECDDYRAAAEQECRYSLALDASTWVMGYYHRIRGILEENLAETVEEIEPQEEHWEGGEDDRELSIGDYMDYAMDQISAEKTDWRHFPRALCIPLEQLWCQFSEDEFDRAWENWEWRCECGNSRGELELPYGLEAKEDGSVSGPEIVTCGPNTVAKAERLLTEFANSNAWESDVGCSFHIHISLPGVKHVHGRHLQRNLMAYIITHAAGPEFDFLLDRWTGCSPTSRMYRNTPRGYFKLQESDEGEDEDRYLFAVQRSAYNTWELRGFGNVNTVAEGKLCLDLAVRAFQHAYRVKLGLEEPILGEEFEDEEGKVFSSNKKADKFIKADLKLLKVLQGITAAENTAVDVSEFGGKEYVLPDEERPIVWTNPLDSTFFALQELRWSSTPVRSVQFADDCVAYYPTGDYGRTGLTYYTGNALTSMLDPSYYMPTVVHGDLGRYAYRCGTCMELHAGLWFDEDILNAYQTARQVA